MPGLGSKATTELGRKASELSSLVLTFAEVTIL